MKVKKTKNGCLVRCDIGDEIVSTLSKFAKENKIYSGTITGIGALKDIELGYFNFDKKEYLRKKFDGIYELLSLNGNFARLNDDVILHSHAVISDINFNVIGGHLFSGVVAVTGEFYIRNEDVEINRDLDEITGLNLIKF